jgi:hypothetical protein
VKAALTHPQEMSRPATQLLTESAARIKEGKHDLALQNLEAIDTTPPYANYLRGLIAYQQARYEESIKLLRKTSLELFWYPNMYQVMRKSHLGLSLNMERLKFLMDQIKLVSDASKTLKESCPSILTKAEGELERTVWVPGFYGLLAACSKQMGKMDMASIYAGISQGMVNSLDFNGLDGRSYKSAIPVVNVPEEYPFLSRRNYQRTGQIMNPFEGKRYDVLTAKANDTGSQRQFYFDISEITYALPSGSPR